MVNAFRKSRLIAYAGGSVCAVAAALIAFFALTLRDMSTGARVTASLLIAAVVFYLVYYIARIIAVREYQDKLMLLYRDLDPEALIHELEGILSSRIAPQDRAMAMIYLSNAYLYSGNAEKALEILSSMTAPEKELEARGLIYGNKASCYIRLAKAEAASAEISSLISLTREKKIGNTLKSRFSHTSAYLKLCVEIISGRKIDPAVLENDFSSSKSKLHKLDDKYMLMKYYTMHGNLAKAEEAESYLTENQNKCSFI